MASQDEIRSIVADNVRRLIADLGFSVDATAERAAMSRDHLYKILREETDISYEKLGGLAKALNAEVSDLFKAEPRSGNGHSKKRESVQKK